MVRTLGLFSTDTALPTNGLEGEAISGVGRLEKKSLVRWHLAIQSDGSGTLALNEICCRLLNATQFLGTDIARSNSRHRGAFDGAECDRSALEESWPEGAYSRRGDGQGRLRAQVIAWYKAREREVNACGEEYWQ